MQRPAEATLSRWRWAMLGFVVASIVINGFDRLMIAMLKPDILAEFGWDDAAYGRLSSAFQLGAVATLLLAGWFVDRVGIRRGYAVGNGLWGLATLAHVPVSSFAGMVGLRGLLGAVESIQTPAAVKTIASWFPQRETSLALGIMNSAANLGAIVVPLTVPLLAALVGWRNSFIVVGGMALAWMLVWLLVRAPAPPAEVAVGPAPDEPERWADLLKDRRVGGFAIAKILSDQVWWLMVFWLPDFLMRGFALPSTAVAGPVALAFAMAIAGAMSGGWLSGHWIAGGTAPGTARLRVMLLYGSIALVMPLALFAPSVWTAALLVGVVLFAHQGFSTNLFATVTDLFPARRVASVISMGAVAGNLWGAGFMEITGQLLAAGGSYLPLFIVCGLSYLTATLFIRWLMLRGATPAGAVA